MNSLLLAQEPLIIVLGMAGALVLLVFFIIVANFGFLYIQALMSGAPVALWDLVGMRLRKVDPRLIVITRITASKAGLPITTDKLEAHYLAGGHVERVVNALIAANKASIPLTFDRATAIDLAGRDVLEAVHTSVQPKVIDCPDPRKGRDTISAVAKNGIELKVKARITVRTNLDRLIGGATEETIIARVGEGIVTSVGSADDHHKVLENPDQISKKVLEKGLDAGTAFEILSIDIADIDVGENIGAKLRTDQAEADKKVAQAEAEKRRAMAVATEQEMQAKAMENRAEVIKAEAEIPQAIAAAFRAGNLGVMDYYKMKNVQADTDMRKGIGGNQQGKS
ncbi:MAG: hypothetical protein FD180_2562 [Planctomycetota bacterium]|nr:MAG: hypothetical protein FD180_2562 [Planctomycetota bacterium]